jgi:hypothetical protein
MFRRNEKISRLLSVAIVGILLTTSGCAAFVLGAVAGGGGYEAYQASEMDDLEKDYAAGKISKQEYEARKAQIDDTSVFQ